MRFGSQEGTLACVLAPKRAVYHVLTSQWGRLVCFANHEGTLVRVLAPNRAFKPVFWLSRGHFSVRFGFQEGTLARFWLPRGHFSTRMPPPCAPLALGALRSSTLTVGSLHQPDEVHGLQVLFFASTELNVCSSSSPEHSLSSPWTSLLYLSHEPSSPEPLTCESLTSPGLASSLLLSPPRLPASHRVQ